MGVPKFFRWLSERYPKINQRAGFLPCEKTCMEHFGKLPPPPIIPPDPLSTCGLTPPIDRLYVDMNGIIHGCSHNNNNSDDDSPAIISREEIFQNVAFYLDRIVGDIVKPTSLLYLSIDGVAPRAKLNQQRSRRYRSGNEGEIEESIYEAHLRQSSQTTTTNNDDDDKSSSHLKEVEPGRFTGKFESHDESTTPTNQSNSDAKFHHNEITPGTPFFQECTDFLQDYIQRKVATDPINWQHLDVIFSGPDVPGEGEHKIMDFIRREKYNPNYDPNTTHCIMGQDGDWIMLGLATHEPNLVLLREQVVFDSKRQALLESHGIDSYLFNANFEFLHLSILRDYLAFEFETRPVVASSKFDVEATIDDFVFLTFLVGNDFLPHLPALDIADEAFDLLFQVYKKQRNAWQNDKSHNHPYLTHKGTIVSGKRLQEFVCQVGQHEFPYYDNKKRVSLQENERVRKSDKKFKRPISIPQEDVLQSKEEEDRQKYRQMLQSTVVEKAPINVYEFSPVLTKADVIHQSTAFQPTKQEDQVEEGLVSRMSNLLQFSIQGDEDSSTHHLLDDQDLKGRYYYDKFGFTPFDAEKHVALRKAYVEGLVWNLKYYYQGCVSWDWYYPYHYGPMLSDLVNIDEMLDEINFDELGEPLRPFEQLMGCMPPSSAHLLPEPYQWLLTESSSPLIDFYPRTFTVDMNGKRWPWEAVVLLPFIDAERLIGAARGLVREDLLTEEEKKRNRNGHAWVISRDSNTEKAQTVPLESTDWDYQPEETAILQPELPAGVEHPRAGFPTLKEAPIRSLWRRNVGLNVFGMRSRYRTALLVLGEVLPTTPPVELLGKQLIGTTIYINYPYFTEAFVTAVSDSESTMRGVGDKSLRQWDANELLSFRRKSSAMKKNQAFGEKLTGSGGWMMPDHDIMVSVRPLKGLKTLADGSSARVFAKFEVDIPLTAAVWAPSYEDSRLANVPALMEKDPYSLAEKEKKAVASASTLLPEYEEPDPKSDPYAPPLILPAFEDQDPKVMHPPHDELSLEQKPCSPTNSVNSVTASSILPPEDETLFPSQDDIAPIASRGFATSARNLRNPLLRPNQKRSLSTATRGASRHASIGNPRARLFALGVAAAAVFIGGAHAISQTNPSVPRQTVIVSSFSLFGIRGGDQFDTETTSLLDDVKPPPLEFAHGTTTLSFTFDGGIVAAVDSRASLGNFVGSKTTQKVLPISSHVLGTMAGGAADCMFWIRKIQAEAQLHELSEEGRRMSVARASKLLASALYQNRGLELSVGTMIMGFDVKTGPQIYYVDNTGARIHGDLFAVGSGSTFAYAILDTERRKDMKEDEAIALGIKAIRHATFRDAFSGGFINVYVINEDGWRKVFSEDLARTPADVHVVAKRESVK